MDQRVAIVDLDGTVYRGESLIPGADRGLATLRDAGYAIRFVSNSPTNSPSEYADRLRRMGIEADPDQIFSSGAVTTSYLTRTHPEANVLLIGSTGLREQLRAAGLSVTDDPIAGDVLLVSWDPEFGYGDMATALKVLDDETPFYGTDPDRTYPTQDGTLAPGSGAIIHAVSGVTEREPDRIFGKPGEAMREAALDGLDVDPADCLVVGDRLSTDIALGESVGMRTVLVRSGVTDAVTLDRSDRRPDHVVDSLADIGTVLSG